jgi:hypothetical protein
MKIWLGLLIILGCIINKAQADDDTLGQVLQINTHFRTLYGTPSWLLIVRDVETGLVSPYQFDIHQEDNYWIAFTYGHTYKITASSLTFGPYAKIKNFCKLESGILTGQSMTITLTGVLSPVTSSYRCRVSKYKNMQFTITNSS